MATFAGRPVAARTWTQSTDDAADLTRLEARLPQSLSFIAGMVDLTGFFKLGTGGRLLAGDWAWSFAAALAALAVGAVGRRQGGYP